MSYRSFQDIIRCYENHIHIVKKITTDSDDMETFYFENVRLGSVWLDKRSQKREWYHKNSDLLEQLFDLCKDSDFMEVNLRYDKASRSYISEIYYQNELLGSGINNDSSLALLEGILEASYFISSDSHS